MEGTVFMFAGNCIFNDSSIYPMCSLYWDINIFMLGDRNLCSIPSFSTVSTNSTGENVAMYLARSERAIMILPGSLSQHTCPGCPTLGQINSHRDSIFLPQGCETEMSYKYKAQNIQEIKR